MSCLYAYKNIIKLFGSKTKNKTTQMENNYKSPSEILIIVVFVHVLEDFFVQVHSIQLADFENQQHKYIHVSAKP